MLFSESRLSVSGIKPPTGIFLAAVLLAACETIPLDALSISESSLATRQMQTREYADFDDSTILLASVAVLQDLGYTIDEVEGRLGVLTASKRADATNKLEAFGTLAADSMQCVFTFMLACNRKYYKSIDDVQEIRLTLIVGVKQFESSIPVRITIQRIIWDKAGRPSAHETITDPNVYDALFARLSKAVFLEKETSWSD